jgi:hypothetical protein
MQMTMVQMVTRNFVECLQVKDANENDEHGGPDSDDDGDASAFNDDIEADIAAALAASSSTSINAKTMKKSKSVRLAVAPGDQPHSSNGNNVSTGSTKRIQRDESSVSTASVDSIRSPMQGVDSDDE